MISHLMKQNKSHNSSVHLSSHVLRDFQSRHIRIFLFLIAVIPLWASAIVAWSFTKSISTFYNTKKVIVKKTSKIWIHCATQSQEMLRYTQCFVKTGNWSNVRFVDLTVSAIPKEIPGKCANTQPLSWTLAVTTNAFSSDIKPV